jgi:hypothetical protein
MSYNGSGTFLINTAGQPVVSGTVISSTAFNALTADLATGLSTAITKDGQTTVTANIPMGTYKFTGLGAGTAATDSANLSQVQSTVTKLLASVSGADTITAVGSPTLGAYAAGQMFYFVAASANTGAVTINIDSLGAKSITRDGTTALAAGDIQSGEVCVIVYDGTQFQLVNGASQSASIVTENLTVNKATVLNESGGDNDTRIEGDTDANLFFADASTDRIGVGTSSPDAKFTVNGVGAFGDGAAATPSIANTGDLNTGFWFPADDTIAASTAGSERLRLDSAGNLGLGVSPGSWVTGKAIQVGTTGTSLWGFADTTVLTQNAAGYPSSAFIYGTSAAAARYQMQSGAHSWYTAASGTAGNAITFTQAMTLDASGNLLVGAASGSAISGSATVVAVRDLATSNLSSFKALGGAAATQIEFFGAASTTGVWTSTNHPMLFATNNTERARITAGGYSKFSNDGNYDNSSGSYHEFYQTGGSAVCHFRATSATYTGTVIEGKGDRTTTNSTYNLLDVYNGNLSGRLVIRDSGNALNTNGSYGAISDIKLKQDVSDAVSQWDDIKSIRIRKYRFKNNPDAPLLIGVIAQEIEKVSPGLVDEELDRDREGNDLGTTTKSVKYSILYMKAVKALQEAMARIEKLEAEMAALKGA